MVMYVSNSHMGTNKVSSLIIGYLNLNWVSFSGIGYLNMLYGMYLLFPPARAADASFRGMRVVAILGEKGDHVWSSVKASDEASNREKVHDFGGPRLSVFRVRDVAG